MARATSKRPHPDALRSGYRRALSASVVAHARYLAAEGEKSASPRQIAQRKIAWLAMEARKASMRTRLAGATEVKQCD
jgi:hypothetical protein